VKDACCAGRWEKNNTGRSYKQTPANIIATDNFQKGNKIFIGGYQVVIIIKGKIKQYNVVQKIDAVT
jgi:hypothetical protein